MQHLICDHTFNIGMQINWKSRSLDLASLTPVCIEIEQPNNHIARWRLETFSHFQNQVCFGLRKSYALFTAATSGSYSSVAIMV